MCWGIRAVLDYETFSVSAKDREPLLQWILEALELSGCRILHSSEPGRAPFRVTFETPIGERMGIVAYAFLANTKVTRNRPSDEHRFQIKYGSKDGRLHELWQDPFELYTTLFFGINLDQSFFVAADPLLHSPTLFFISLELKEENARAILRDGWASWERIKRDRHRDEYPREVLVGGTQEQFLRLVRFERVGKGLDPSHRELLAEKLITHPRILQPTLQVEKGVISTEVPFPHQILEELELSETEIFDLIQSAPRLKMAVRGWVAETHLERKLQEIPGVEGCERIEEEGGADIRLRYQGSRPLLIECKNVLRKPLKQGTLRLDFQRTRASKEDPCSRFYSPEDFDLVAACLHAYTEKWDFRYALTPTLDPHRNCPGKLSNLVRIDGRWTDNAVRVLERAAAT